MKGTRHKKWSVLMRLSWTIIDENCQIFPPTNGYWLDSLLCWVPKSLCLPPPVEGYAFDIFDGPRAARARGRVGDGGELLSRWKWLRARWFDRSLRLVCCDTQILGKECPSMSALCCPAISIARLRAANFPFGFRAPRPPRANSIAAWKYVRAAR